RHDELTKLAETKSEQKSWQLAKRGDILDAKGNMLGNSGPVETVWANPALIGNQQPAVARVLAPLLQVSESDLYQRLLPRLSKNSKGENVTNRYVVLQRKVPEETWRKIYSTMTNLPLAADENKMSKSERANFKIFSRDLRQYAVCAEPEQTRYYPNGALAAHVLGFVGARETTNHSAELFGCDGVEKSFDSKLSGASGWRQTSVDSRNRERVELRAEDVGARNGLTVVLTIDSVVQSIVENELARAAKEHEPVSITGIVTRPQTGAILAMATLPNFDPNNPGTVNTNTGPNRVISDVMEPGSTFKTIVISGALNEH